MTLAVILVLIAPLAGAILAPAFAEFPAQRRALAGICIAAMVAGAALALVRTVTGSPVSWRGFGLDPWRALLVAGAVFSSVLAVARADEDERPPLAQAAFFAATAALVVPLFLAGSHTLSLALPVGTAGLAVAAFAATREGPALLRAGRVLAMLAASDVLALVALGMALSNGTRLPPELSLVAGFLLLAAGLVRLGLAPIGAALDEAIEADVGLGLLFGGGVRAQGFLLAVMAIGSHRTIAYAAAAAAALALIVVALRTAGRSSEAPGASVASAGTAVAVLGFALGGPAASWGAVLALATSFAAWPLWSAGGAFGATARASLAAVPAGGLLTGVALVVAAALDAGTVRPWFFALAVPALGALVAVAASVWTSDGEERAGEPIATGVVAAIGLLAALALAAVPVRASTGLGIPVNNALGTGRLLTTEGAPGIPEDVAAAALASGLIAFAAGPGRAGSGGAPGRRRPTRTRSIFDWWARAAAAPAYGSTLARADADDRARRWGAAGALLLAVGVGLALRIYVVSAGRGFL